MAHKPWRFYCVQREADGLFLRRTRHHDIDMWVATPEEASVFAFIGHARACIVRRLSQGPMKIHTLRHLPDGVRPNRRSSSRTEPEKQPITGAAERGEEVSG